MGPGLRRDGVICSEGAMKANWITASCRPGPMLQQAPESDRFCDRVPSDSSTAAALWVPACPTDLGPWAEGPRDGVICNEGAMKPIGLQPRQPGPMCAMGTDPLFPAR